MFISKIETHGINSIGNDIKCFRFLAKLEVPHSFIKRLFKKSYEYGSFDRNLKHVVVEESFY